MALYGAGGVSAGRQSLVTTRGGIKNALEQYWCMNIGRMNRPLSGYTGGFHCLTHLNDLAGSTSQGRKPALG
jgi:hypothetical protein